MNLRTDTHTGITKWRTRDRKTNTKRGLTTTKLRALNVGRWSTEQLLHKISLFNYDYLQREIENILIKEMEYEVIHWREGDVTCTIELF